MTTIRTVPKTKSRHAPSGQNGTPVFFEHFVILLAIGLRMNRLAGGRRFGNAVAQDQPEMERDEDEHQRRHEKDVDREKAAQGRAADRRSAEDELRQPVADERNAPGLFGRDHHRPGGVLIPTQQLAGEIP